MFAVRQQRAALGDLHDEPARVCRVDGDRGGKRRAGGDRTEIARDGRDVRRRANRVDAIEAGADGTGAERVHARFVHVAQVEVADLLEGRPGRSRRSGGVEDDGVQVRLGAVGQFDERAVAHPIRRHVGAREPAPVRVAVEVVLRPDGWVHRGTIEA